MKLPYGSYRQFIVLSFLALGWQTALLPAAIVTHSTQLLATQQVNLLGIDATLVAIGPATFTFDVDASNNTILGGASTMDTLFLGVLPNEFAPLGVAGAPFELFSIDPELVTATNNGTYLRVETTFGFRVFAGPGVVGANFFTSVPSVFEAPIVGLQDFTGAVFQALNRPNDVTQIFIGDSILPGLPPPGSLVGISFNRTVEAVPEPSSLLFCSALALIGLPFSRRRSARS